MKKSRPSFGKLAHRVAASAIALTLVTQTASPIFVTQALAAESAPAIEAAEEPAPDVEAVEESAPAAEVVEETTPAVDVEAAE